MALAIASGAPGLAQAQGKIDRSLQESLQTGGETQQIIVSLKDSASRASVLTTLRAHGDVIKSDHPGIGAFSAVVHSEDVGVLAAYPGISLSADAPVHGGASRHHRASAASNTSSAPTGWLTSTLRESLGLTADSPTGDGVTVVVFDSGIAPIADFGDRLKASYDCTQACVEVPPSDPNGHGTHLAGLIASDGTLSNGLLRGVAPGASLISVRVLAADGSGSTSDVIRGLEFVTANAKLLNVGVGVLSLGHPIFAPAADDPLVQAVEKLSAAGVTVSVAAGNNGMNPKTGKTGYGGIDSPGNAPSALTFGASSTQDTVTLDDDRVANYSSRGPTWYDGFVKPDFVAPGTRLISDTTTDSYLFQQLPNNQKFEPNGQAFLSLTGTSMSNAVGAGVVALVLDAHKKAQFGAGDLTPNTVKAILQYTAIPLRDDQHRLYDVLTQGNGQINAAGAVAIADAIDVSVPLNTWWLTKSVPSFSTIGGDRYVWARNIIWGGNIVRGNLLFYSLRVWTQDVVWGYNIVWADTAGAADRLRHRHGVRGNNIVWADNFDDNIVWGDNLGDDNIVWGDNLGDDNIVWGDHLVWRNVAHVKSRNIVWSSNIPWFDNIVWGDNLIGLWLGDDNIVWGDNFDNDNIVWGDLLNEDNIVWGNLYDDNIVWGDNYDDDNIVWGDSAEGVF